MTINNIIFGREIEFENLIDNVAVMESMLESLFTW